MNWKFEDDLIVFTTEQGTTARVCHEKLDGLVCFTGGTVKQVDDEWYGGVDINYRRYFIREEGKLIPKSYQHTSLAPYTFVETSKGVDVRLWEPIVYHVDKEKLINIEGVNYFLNYKYMSVKALSEIEARTLKKLF